MTKAKNRRIIIETIKELPIAEQKILALYYHEELSIAEIIEVIGEEAILGYLEQDENR